MSAIDQNVTRKRVSSYQTMRKVILLEFVTLDGVIQAGGGPDEDRSGGFAFGGWMAPYTDEVTGSVIREQMSRSFDLLLGRKTYEIWAAYWPHHTERWPEAGRATKYVASNSMTSGEWGPALFLNGDVAERVGRLKKEPGPDLHVYGSSNLVQTLLRHDLVDELWLKIFPLTLGSGKRLFTDGTIPAAFRVTRSLVSPKGVIIVNYERAGTVTTGSL